MTEPSPHAYRPDCDCTTCTGIRVVTDRATVGRMAIAMHDWSGVATVKLTPKEG